MREIAAWLLRGVQHCHTAKEGAYSHLPFCQALLRWLLHHPGRSFSLAFGVQTDSLTSDSKVAGVHHDRSFTRYYVCTRQQGDSCLSHDMSRSSELD